MSQMLLLPDPRPLVERLGLAFFRHAPECPGVYLMRDAADAVLYVGKAKNLRRRLGNYRVANPQRLRRRHLRLLRAVERIELERCPDERAALAREAELLRLLRPRFNRAGTWPGTPRFFAWKTTQMGLDLAVFAAADATWQTYGPLGYLAVALRQILVRLLWCALQPERGLTGMPPGWFDGDYPEAVSIPRGDKARAACDNAGERLNQLFSAPAEVFTEWICTCTADQTHAFERSVRESDLEALTDLMRNLRAKLNNSSPDQHTREETPSTKLEIAKLGP
jgi:predicted GIY-YIG superfamily endonuclease